MDENEKKNEQDSDKNTEETPKRRAGRPRKAATSQSAKKTTASSAKSEPKEPSNLEESILYLKTIGLKKVSNKTFINEKDLAAFLEGDFGDINRTRALGFIQILEREYPVNLQQLRQNYLEYYQQHRPKREEEQLFAHAKAEESYEWQKYLPWIAGLLLLGGLIWYFAGDKQENLANIEKEEKAISHDLNTDIVKKAEKNLVALEKNDTAQKSVPAVESDRAMPFVRGSGNSSNPSTAAVINTTVPAAAVPDSVPAAAVEAKNDAESDVDLDTMVKQMVQEFNLTDEAQQSSLSADTNLTASASSAKSTKESDVKAAAAKPKKAAPTKAHAKEKKKKKIKQQIPVNSKLYIVPRKKSWVGVIYLDDYTKKDFLIRKTLKLNPNRPQLIVVGHRNFEIFNNGYSYRFRAKGPVRFVYKNGEIMEINNREFQKLSKGVAW